MSDMTVELATASYKSFIPAMGVPVATSLGRPKFPISYELTEEVGALKPFGLFGKDLPEDEFRAAYRQRLDKTGIDKLQRVFHTISRKYDELRLVLLCFEDVPAGQSCHRRDFAAWWTERTGVDVPELSWCCGSDGVPVVVREVADR